MTATSLVQRAPRGVSQCRRRHRRGASDVGPMRRLCPPPADSSVLALTSPSHHRIWVSKSATTSISTPPCPLLPAADENVEPPTKVRGKVGESAAALAGLELESESSESEADSSTSRQASSRPPLLFSSNYAASISASCGQPARPLQPSPRTSASPLPALRLRGTAHLEPTCEHK